MLSDGKLTQAGPVFIQPLLLRYLMIIFNVAYAPLHSGAWAVDVSKDGHPEFVSRQDALRFAIGAALKAETRGEDARIAIEGVDGRWRLFDHEAKGIH
jgi:hypothetical protein